MYYRVMSVIYFTRSVLVYCFLYFNKLMYIYFSLIIIAELLNELLYNITKIKIDINFINYCQQL